MNAVEYTKKAAKQLRKIPLTDSTAIFDQCRQLERFPQCDNVKALTKHAYQYRLRVGRYRVFFNFDGVVHVVSIEEVRKRDERTY